MNSPARPNTDHWIAVSLRAGAYSSFGLLVAALTLALAKGNAWESLARIGIWFLLATPVLRIIVACLAFARERDRKYLAISLGVLAIVLTATWFGMSH